MQHVDGRYTRRADTKVISGDVVPRPTKRVLAGAIARELGLPEPDVSTGASVESNFIERVHEVLFGRSTGGANANRKTERLLLQLGRTYDAYWDTSESRGPTSGSTVTARAYSQILSAITGVDRCFLFGISASGEIRRTHHIGPGSLYGGERALLDAGPGSKVIFHAVGQGWREGFVGSAVVHYIGPGWSGPVWDVDFENHLRFEAPVPVSREAIRGWDLSRLITEVTPETYESISEVGRARHRVYETPTAETLTVAPEWRVTGSGEGDRLEPAGDAIVGGILNDFPAMDHGPTLAIPTSLPVGRLEPVEVSPVHYIAGEGEVHGEEWSSHHPAPDRRRDKLSEQRAVALTVSAMESSGWSLARDRQMDGVGYDLDFVMGARELHVEVKGIQGNALTFNLTPKEFWRAQTDDSWVLIAVTNVLSPTDYSLNLVTRDRLVAASRVVTGYRLSLE